MKHHSTPPPWLVLAGGLLVCVSPFNRSLAGSVITANLPANTAIINISATQDGAAAYNPGSVQPLWYQPFSTLGAANLLEYTVQPGTYGFRVIDPADAVQLYPALTAAQTSQIFTAWTFNSPWATDYLVFDSAAATNSTLYQLFDGAFSNTNGVTWYTYANAAAAYQAAVTNGFYNLIRSGPSGRAGTNFTTRYTFDAPETLIFVVPDYALSDNSGGISVLISPAAAIAVPTLSIYSGDVTVNLQWPTNANGFYLETETNLFPAVWSTITNEPSLLNTNYSVTLPADPAGRFYRLHHN